MNTLLEDITSGDSHRVWSSSCAVITLRDTSELNSLASNLQEIKGKTRNLALGGALFPNSEHLKFALRKLEYHKECVGCLCLLYPEYLMYDPQKEAEAGNVRIESITYIEGKWVDAYTCICTSCGTHFRVEEREYHYTWWGWIVQPYAELGSPPSSGI
jgi:hypothetical protein